MVVFCLNEFIKKEYVMKQLNKLCILLVLISPWGTRATCSNNSGCDNGNCDSCCSTDLSQICGGSIITNKTTYIDVGIGQPGTYLHENFFRNNRMDLREDGWRSAWQFVPFGGQTTGDGSNGLGRRFGLNGKRCMTVFEGDNSVLCGAGSGLSCTAQGNNSTPTGLKTRDIDPQNFNIETVNGDFQSTICFCPKETIAGILISWKQGIGCSSDTELTRFWFELNFPIIHTKHDMRLVETVTVDGGGAKPNTIGLDNAQVVGTMAEAFCQPNWQYGKICGYQEGWELANFDFLIGINNTISDCCDSAFYLGFAAPTTRKRTAEFVFEPVIGEEHWAIIWGSNWDVCFCEWGASSLYAYLAINSYWWFNANELRSFDLVGKPWSRYQEMYENLEAATLANTNANIRSGTSGINILTRCVDIDPGYQVNLNAAVMYKGYNFVAEVGHTFYARQAEKIHPNWTINTDFGPVIKDVTGDGNLNIARTISNQFPASVDLYATLSAGTEDNYTFDQIQTCDVDWNSGAHEGILGNTIYGSLGYENLDWCYPTLVSIGGSFDFQTEDEGTSQLRRWTVFGKLELSF